MLIALMLNVGGSLTALTVTEILAGALVWRFHSGAWKRIELIEPQLV